MIYVKTIEEIEKIKIASRAVATILNEAKKVAVEGATAWDLELLAENVLKELKCEPAFKDYHGYPYITTVSVNDEVIHGFPLKHKVFKKGDIVSLDVGAIYKGYYGDGAYTYIIGETDEMGQKLVETTKRALEIAVKTVRAGIRLGDVSAKIQQYVEKNGFNVVRDFVGHGVGKKLHEDPQIPNYGKEGTGIILRENMTIAIEPMVTEGGWHVVILEDGWTVVTVDGKRAAHFEHTLWVKKEGCEVLTQVG
ncbi:methionine aminopeptidase [Thermosipho melanesiensis]|uniref:Methionine aminopeptidase n=2 Tax=Thermosipho melanesiensis TaxID=46541 RepID=A6LLN5_THEM4|nr:type I methionyl aminopeptidase [Thermosipho melanesiensis]ABR30836.1 methionine aminopeptidase, type I [Thermosipho melanesiensis BI429]APT73956.1 methionine aminopeptidase [Thermosipho melanesiensis]OOC35892.1 methionine aminopeptidase [Thermosipho melanesiensis]OOC38394.1 methionine aminopeptidase [Thermosipho melanesiensis]OOC38855.1 methionine aminopeptidase [Thermosipho melanesiensis]